MILTYHSLDASGSVISVSPEAFRAHMEHLAASSLRVAPLAAALAEPRSIAITFDDGFRNFLRHALPVLTRHGFPSTVFAVSGYCGRDNRWPTQPAAGIPTLGLMGWSDLREAAQAGVCIGAHTITHPDLTAVSAEAAEAEIRDSRKAIEDRTGLAVDTFAYPYGKSSPAVRCIAARYYRIACGTELRPVRPDSDLLDLPRIDAYYFRDPQRFRMIGAPTFGPYLHVRRTLRAIRHLFTS